MKYSKDVTINHPISSRYKRHLIELNELMRREGANRDYFNNDTPVIDLDAIEKSKRTGFAKETMDFSIGLSHNHNRQMLLVEAKIRVANSNNLNKSELSDKIKHSKELLTHEITISKDMIFLFQEKIIQKAKHTLLRHFNNNPNFKACTISQFKEEYFQ